MVCSHCSLIYDNVQNKFRDVVIWKGWTFIARLIRDLDDREPRAVALHQSTVIIQLPADTRYVTRWISFLNDIRTMER